jgi:hypothetical protein
VNEYVEEIVPIRRDAGPAGEGHLGKDRAASFEERVAGMNRHQRRKLAKQLAPSRAELKAEARASLARRKELERAKRADQRRAKGRS